MLLPASVVAGVICVVASERGGWRNLCCCQRAWWLVRERACMVAGAICVVASVVELRTENSENKTSSITETDGRNDITDYRHNIIINIYHLRFEIA